jgi:sulfoxide reductase heme-binding subunit YedZ
MSPAELNRKLVPHARTLTYALAALILLLAVLRHADPFGKNVFSLANDFGYLGFLFVSLALCVSPIRTLFPQFAFNPSLYLARRALGVSAFCFVVFHATIQLITFFRLNVETILLYNAGQDNAYLASGIAFVILLAMAATSTNWAVSKLGKRWNTLHRFVYVAYPLIVYHALKAGVDFTRTTLSGQLFIAVTILLVALEIARFFKERGKRPPAEKIPLETKTSSNSPAVPTTPGSAVTASKLQE